MRLLPILALVSLAGCSYSQYVYGFDITNSGAVNSKAFRGADTLEDADVKLEVRPDPTDFRAIEFDITNRTDAPLTIDWRAIVLVDPQHKQTTLAPQAMLGPIEPGARKHALVGPFVLPSLGGDARQYDGGKFELVIPAVVRGQPHEYRLHLRATLKRV